MGGQKVTGATSNAQKESIPFFRKFLTDHYVHFKEFLFTENVTS